MEADNHSDEISLVDLAKQIWKFKYRILKWSAAGALLGLIIGFSIPKEYVSVVSLAPEGDGAKNGSLGELASIVGVGSMNDISGINLMLYPQIVSSTPFLLEFAPINVTVDDRRMVMSEYLLKHQRQPWYSAVIKAPFRAIAWVMSINDGSDTLNLTNSPKILDNYRKALQSRIMANVDKKTGVITVTSTFQDPLIAKSVADSVVNKLQEYMTSYKTAKTRANLEANQKLLDEAKERYYAADANYAAALDRNRNLILRSAGVQLDRLRNERDLTFQLYQQLSSQVEVDRVKLQEDTPIATVIDPARIAPKASSPRKLLLLVAFAFLGGVACLGVAYFRKEIHLTSPTAPSDDEYAA